MKKKVLGILFLTFICISTIFSQGFNAPSAGKSFVYFVRVTPLAPKINFEYFEKNKFIGEFKASNYIRIECETGEHLFWGVCDNKDFITIDCKAGESYFVVVDVLPGAFRARIRFTPLTSDNSILLSKVKSIINDRKPIETAEKILKDKNEKKKMYIATTLSNYEQLLKTTKNYQNMTQDMFIPMNILKQ